MIISRTLKPVCKYFGGKSGMINKIKKYFPQDGSFNTYIEPFSGSFSIGLTVDVPNLIYNDLDKNVYALHKVLSDKKLFARFKETCDLTPYSEDLRKEFKHILKDKNLSLLNRAFAFFYVNRSSHNGVGSFSINTCVRRNMSKSVSDYLSVIDRLPELHQKLSKVIVTNKDGIDLIAKYDKSNVFYYLDPPYSWDTRGTARYEVDMDNETQERLIDTLLNIKEAKVLISGYECELYNKLEQAGWKKEQFEVNTVDGNRNPKIKTETCYFNY